MIPREPPVSILPTWQQGACKRGNGGEWTTCYVLYDPQGNVAGLATADGTWTLVAQYDYDPYGRLIRETGPKAASCTLRYSTKYRDPDLDLYYYGYRWYDAASLKWLTPDPIGERGGANLTAFCNGDPINRVDPLGLRYRPVLKYDEYGRLVVEMEYYAPAGEPGTGYSLEAFYFIAGREWEGLWDEFDVRFHHVISRATREYPFGDLSEWELQEAVRRGYVSAWDWPFIAVRDSQGDWLVGKTGRDALVECAWVVGCSIFFGVMFGEFRMPMATSPKSVTHLTSPERAVQIRQLQRIGGRWGIHALESGKVPRSMLGRHLKTLVVSDVSAEVEITGPAVQAFKKPPMFGPFSIARRLAGVRSTPLGSIDLRTGQFVFGEVLKNGSFRAATAGDAFLYKGHQFVLDYGVDLGIYAAAGLYCFRDGLGDLMTDWLVELFYEEERR
jgi:RHS repeat-associated protein